MTKTAHAPRARALNLYTVDSNGQPVAQAMAISQAEAVRLYVESVQQPTMTARLSSPLEARTLAGLPLLTRGEPVRDTAMPDLFGDDPAAPVSPVAGAVVDPVLLAPMPSPPGELVATPPDHGRYGCDGVYRHPPAVPAQIAADLAPDRLAHLLGMAPPQHAPIEAVTEGLASGAEDQPGELVAGDCAEPAGAPADASPASADAPMLSERMAGAYAAGVEIARQGHTRWSTAFLDADAAALSGLRDAAADAVHAEMLRGFDDGKAQAEPVGTQERRRPPDEAPKGAGKVLVKYRNQATGESWSGRGLRPRWVVLAMDEGKALEDFAV